MLLGGFYFFMNNAILTTILVGISLSMDAFSLSLIYGTLNITTKNKVLISFIVGIYHFIMPLLGLSIGSFLIKYLTLFNLNFLVAIIFIIIGIELIISNYKDKKIVPLENIISFLIFGLSVSIDSFTTGIGLNIINNNFISVSTTFCLISALFTFVGLNIGDKISRKYGQTATLFGGIILILLALSYIF